MEKHSIRLPNKFDFHYHRVFNQDLDLLLAKSDLKEIELDFSQVQYLDSSALGMLVLMSKKNEESAQAKLVIRGAQGNALDILEMANMAKLYAFL
ncbi:STAS domain-containing protein [Motilimonas cestriensis]|uniref:STAS domain-containing protein n=1 Tax=Motilimonas cestriensis TaxID=2742685 RepID=A0ABS8WH18_9GAMM|nr:STAS domain-containing protein [Motilimonas cestriensis]MCE2596899.1 STAS domain-containing protein [Motilimonas cestriensis]